jgi:hypothetical protein
MANRKHLIKFLSVWLIWVSEWFLFFFLHYACYSKGRNCSAHILNWPPYSFVLVVYLSMPYSK